MNTRIRLVHCDTLSCEPILRRTPDGNLLCVGQCGDLSEPAPGNRVYAFRSEDQGETWHGIGSVYPETGEAVYATEATVLDGVVSAFLQVHSGRFLNMRCVVMQSRDNGLTWTNAGAPPYFPTFCFVRSMLPLNNGEIILACQYFPVSEAENARVVTGSAGSRLDPDQGNKPGLEASGKAATSCGPHQTIKDRDDTRRYLSALP